MINYKMLNRPVDIQAYMPCHKCDWVESAIQAGGNLLGSIFGFGSADSTSKNNLKAQRETNQMNWNIAQLNNEYNERQFNKQLQYNWDMFDAQTAYNEKMLDYNSPVNQANRLREAGLNPYMNGVQAGTASTSSPSAQGVNPPTASPVTMQAPQKNIDGILGVIDSFMQNSLAISSQYYQNQKLKAEAQREQILNKTLNARSLEELNKLKADVRGSNAKSAIDEIEYSLRNATFSDDIAKNHFESQNAERQGLFIQAQTTLAEMQTRLADTNDRKLQKEIGYMDDQNKFHLALLASQTMLNHAKRDESRQAAIESLSRQLLNEKTLLNMPNITKSQADKLASAIVSKAEYENTSAYWNSIQDKVQAGILRKQFGFYDADKLSDYIGKLATGVAVGAGGAFTLGKLKGLKGIKKITGFK